MLSVGLIPPPVKSSPGCVQMEKSETDAESFWKAYTLYLFVFVKFILHKVKEGRCK